MARRIRGPWSPRRDGTITDTQRQYLRRLLDAAYVAQYPHRTGLDRHHLDCVSMAEASAAIGTLRAAQQRGWRDDIEGACSPVSRWPLETIALVDRAVWIVSP